MIKKGDNLNNPLITPLTPTTPTTAIVVTGGDTIAAIVAIDNHDQTRPRRQPGPPLLAALQPELTGRADAHCGTLRKAWPSPGPST
jgi:hypothetical protein